MFSQTSTIEVFSDLDEGTRVYWENGHLPAETLTASVDKRGRFKFHIPLDSTTIQYLRIGEVSYPIWLERRSKTQLLISKEQFPYSVDVLESSSSSLISHNNRYQHFLEQDRQLILAIQSILDADQNATFLDVIQHEKLRVQLALETFANTEFDRIVYTRLNHFLVRGLEFLYLNKTASNASLLATLDQLLVDVKRFGYFTRSCLTSINDDMFRFFDAYFQVSLKLFGKPGENAEIRFAKLDDDNGISISEPEFFLLRHIEDQDVRIHLEYRFIEYLMHKKDEGLARRMTWRFKNRYPSHAHLIKQAEQLTSR